MKGTRFHSSNLPFNKKRDDFEMSVYPVFKVFQKVKDSATSVDSDRKGKKRPFRPVQKCDYYHRNPKL